MSVNVLVVDDHEMVRMGLHRLFEGSEVHVVADAANGAEAVALTKKHKPDVVLLDLRMENECDFATLDTLCKDTPESKVVILSTYDNPTYVARAVALGASDYVLKGTPRRDLIATICAIAAGEAPTASGVMRKIAGTMDIGKQPSDDVPLTNRETQVLRHIGLGLSNKEIAKSLGISVETVKEHVQNILRKIKMTDRTQAAVWAVRNNLV